MKFFLIAFVASAVGALSGLGGGVIIKPVLDAVTSLSSLEISFLSTATVFTMSAVATMKHILSGHRLWEQSTIILGIGATFGGIIGAGMLNATVSGIQQDGMVKIIQNSVLLVLLVVIMCYLNTKNKRQFRLQNMVCIFGIGVMLGAVSSFLGIGGGPINIAALTLFFSMDLRKATVSSMVLILFSQASKLATGIVFHTFPQSLDGRILVIMMSAGVIGGFVGAALNRRISKAGLKTAYYTVMTFVIFTCLWNILKLL